MKFDLKSFFNTLNIDFIKIDNQNIIYIESDNDIFLNVYKHAIIRFDKYKIKFFYILREVLILNLKELFKIIKSLI